jgi:DNA (cytosine-5)-methyltransferase 1
MVRPTVISTFAGGGGSSLGYHWAGYKELLAIDFEKNACDTLKANFPDLTVWQRDITTVQVNEILQQCKIKSGELDILDGSPPCQGFSTAGKRNLNDSRNDLFKEFVRLIEGLQPKVFIMENVSGMIKGGYKGKFNEILQTLKDTGYNVKCKLMNAMWYEVPQSRERVFFIGVRNDLNIEPSFPEPLKTFITVKESIGNLEEIEIKNRKDITKGLRQYAEIMKEGESASKYHKNGSCFGLIRIDSKKPCNTIIKSAGTGLLHYKYNLSFLSTNELQLLASFPLDYKFLGTRGDKIDRIGNAVMPKMMFHIAKHIKESILNNDKT